MILYLKTLHWRLVGKYDQQIAQAIKISELEKFTKLNDMNKTLVNEVFKSQGRKTTHRNS